MATSGCCAGLPPILDPPGLLASAARFTAYVSFRRAAIVGHGANVCGVKDTWVTRDLPVLDAIVTILEDEFEASVPQVAAMTGLPAEEVTRAFYALQGQYVGQVLARMGNWPAGVHVKEVTGDARRAVGQWPTAENLVSRLSEAFAVAADKEGDPDKKGRLRKLADGLGGAGRDIAVSVISQIVEAKARQIGLS